MNENMQQYPNYFVPPMNGENSGNAAMASRLKYNNIILTVLLGVIVVAAVGVVLMTARMSGEMQDVSKNVSIMQEDIDHIEKNVNEIMEQGCNGNSGSSSGSGYYYWEDPYGYEEDKPVIYLYPDEAQIEAHVELELANADMTTTWPFAVQNGDVFSWDVTACDDGRIFDADGNEYSYLFWEAKDYGAHSFDKGFCVAGEDTAEFLRDTLTEIGLTPKEYNEFIVYWLPKMQDNAYNITTFEGLDPGDAYNTNNRLSVTDADGNEADSMLRIMMVWKAADEAVEIEAQEFETFERKGFTVVEWGGTEVR